MGRPPAAKGSISRAFRSKVFCEQREQGRAAGHRRRPRRRRHRQRDCRPRLPRFDPPAMPAADSFPSAEGTAILNLSSEQFAGIRKLLIGLRLGRSIADDVRAEIFRDPHQGSAPGARRGLVHPLRPRLTPTP